MSRAPWQAERVQPRGRLWTGLLVAGWTWGSTSFDAARGSHVPSAWPPLVVAILATALQAGASMLEAAWYGVIARAHGARPRWRELAPSLFMLSTLSAIAGWLATRDLARTAAGLVLLGVTPPAATWGDATAGRILGGVGLIAGVRLLGTTHAVAASARLPYRAALVAVTCSWLAARIATMLVRDLLLGRSGA